MARTPQPEPTDSRILRIAADHVRQYGVERTTVVSIAAEAGMTSCATSIATFPLRSPSSTPSPTIG